MNNIELSASAKAATDTRRSLGEGGWVWVPFEVDKQFDGYRIDRFLAQRLQSYSRNEVQKILEDARVVKEGRPARASSKVRTGDKIQIAYLRCPEPPLAEDAALPVLYEDEDLLVVNKPAGLLSHPTDKIVSNTVLGVLRYSRKDIKKLHLLHRLDRETSGVLTLAKNPQAARLWTSAMEAHQMQKEYLAIVQGRLSKSEGVIDWPIGREGGDIKVRQWVNVPGAVPAVTYYRVTQQRSYKTPSPLEGEGWDGGTKTPPANPPPQSSPARGEEVYSVVSAFPKTGRLHQIRVHFAALGHPLLGDLLYNGQGKLYLKMIHEGLTEQDRLSLGCSRLALHAVSLTFSHPLTGRKLTVEAPVPDELAALIQPAREF